MNNSTKIMFTMTLIGGMLLTISSNSWVSAWMGLEVNLLSFIPMMTNYENIYTTESSMKYFMIQALSSSALLFSIMMLTMMEESNLIKKPLSSDFLIMIPLLLKSGLSPFHWWFISVMEGLSWMNCTILMTVQKISPMVLISNILKTSQWLMMIILMSIIIGAVGGLNQTSIRKIMAYSSINHMGWLLINMLVSENLWTVYMMVYSMLIMIITTSLKMSNVSFINQMYTSNYSPMMKFTIFMNLLSLAGLPPFLGFLPKWLIIQYLLQNNVVIVSVMMIMFSLLTLYYYLRIFYSTMLMNYSENNWYMFTPEKNYITNSILCTISITGLTSTSMLINLQ